MKNHLFNIIVLAFFLLSLHQTGVAQQVHLPHYTTKNGLPSNNCYYTLQDKKGYLWIATEAGVSRFDGSVFENFTIDDGLPDNQILQLREDRKGRIWFFALNGELSYFYNGIIFNQHNDKQLGSLNFNGVVVSFFEDNIGKTWFGTSNNLIGIWDGNKASAIKPAANIPYKYQNTFIYQDDNGDIKALNSSFGFIYKDSNFVPHANGSLPISYKTIQHAPNKGIYFIDHEGLKLRNADSTRHILSLNKQLLNTNLGHINVDKGGLWLCNNAGAIYIAHNGTTKQYLIGTKVNQTLTDKNENVWFTTENGLYKLPPVKDQLYKYQHKHNNVFKSITKDSSNRLWLGSTNGSINILDIKTKKLAEIKLADTSKFNLIKQLAIDSKNQQLFFASDYGLGTINLNYPSKKEIHFLKESNNVFFVIKNFAFDASKKLALSLSSGVVIIEDRKQLEFSSLKYKEQQNFFKDRSYSVFFDKGQHLWFSNTSGLFELNGTSLQPHYNHHLLLTKRINDIQQLQDGSMAMATDGYGIIIYNKNKITHTVNKKNGLHNNIINKLFVKDQYLWAISNTGINRILIEGDNIKINSFDDIDGIISDNLNDLYIDRDTAYFATNNGLVYFAHNPSQPYSIAPTVHINSIINNHKLLDLTYNAFVFRPHEQNIIINYSAIDFKNKNILYRYRLKSNGKWVETKNRRLELSALEPGEYTFEISAKNQNSEWSTPTTIKLSLVSPFYQSWWFMGGLIVLGTYAIYSITSHLSKKQKDKEQEQLLLKNEILMLEQKALQAMMNPHFVFNVMNSIQHYINTKNTASANKILTGFARLIRKNLEMCTQSYITLVEEIDYLNLYLDLEKSRFGDKLQYAMNIDPHIDIEETFIPSMLLQPYIENAIWHGIMPKEEGGHLTINIWQQDENYLLIEIIDNGIGIENSLHLKKDTYQSKGMELTHNRIKLLNKIEAKAIQLNVKQNGKTGTTVSIRIPSST